MAWTVNDLSAIRWAVERSRVALEQELGLRTLRDRHASLTAREKQVMALVVAGRLNKQIAGDLGISEITAKAHRGKVVQRMKAGSRAELGRPRPSANSPVSSPMECLMPANVENTPRRKTARTPPDASAGDGRRYATKNDLPVSSRSEAIGLLNQRLADCIDLQTQCKQAHWNVKGPQFIALHKLFDEVNEEVEEYVDLLAERIVQLGGVAEGTARSVARRTSLLDYPLTLASGAEHVAALSDALAEFGRSARIGIEEMNELEDAASADILTEITRGVDKWLWFVEAHQQDRAGDNG